MNEKTDFLKIISKTACELLEHLKDIPYWNARFDHFARFSARFTGRPIVDPEIQTRR